MDPSPRLSPVNEPEFRRILLLSAGFLFLRVASAAIVSTPGYTDAYYYVDVARNLARGDGLTADLVWSPLEAPGFPPLPIPSHRFWMPLVSVLAGGSIALLADAVGPFRAAQAPILLVSALVPLAGYLAARSLRASEGWSLVAASLIGFGGLFAPAWVTLDAYGLAALLGTAFFLLYARAADGSVRAGALCGLTVGALYLARAEAALFGIPLLVLCARAETRKGGTLGAAIALAIGLAWLARDLVLGSAGGGLARSALLVRYEDLFAVSPPSVSAFFAALAPVLGGKLAALGANALTFLFGFALLPVVGLAFGAWRLRDRADVRAFIGLALGIYLAESVVFTLHSTRGSYVHSLATFLPFGFALACAGAEGLFAASRRGARALAVGSTVVGSVAISAAALVQFDQSFVAGERTRAAAVSSIPAGPLMAVDAAAWHWIAGRPAIVTPADGLDMAACMAAIYGVRSLVLEPVHFTAYDDLYRSGVAPPWLGQPVDVGPVRIFPVRGELGCSLH